MKYSGLKFRVFHAMNGTVFSGSLDSTRLSSMVIGFQVWHENPKSKGGLFFFLIFYYYYCLQFQHLHYLHYYYTNNYAYNTLANYFSSGYLHTITLHPFLYNTPQTHYNICLQNYWVIPTSQKKQNKRKQTNQQQSTTVAASPGVRF